MDEVNTVAQADEIISKDATTIAIEEISIHDAVGRILREDLFADRDFPPFSRSMMDGISFSYKAYESGRREFQIVRTIAAGEEAGALTDCESCVEIMTGAGVPKGCDCVIPVEQVSIRERTVTVQDGEIVPQQYIHRQGNDYKKGERLLTIGNRLTAAQIAVAASVGKIKLRVSRKPKIAVVSTGDELVDIGQPVKSYQIRKSNEYALKAAFDQTGLADSTVFHFRDDKAVLTKHLSSILSQFDIIVSSGGVSMGKFDFLPEVLQELGVKRLLYKIRQKPGKPMWFGLGPQGNPVFALPGNPVSTQILAYRYVIPYIKKIVAMRAGAPEYGLLGEDYDGTTDLSFFLPVTVSCTPEAVLAVCPRPPSGSGDFVTLARAEGFIELPPEKRKFKRGERFRLFRF